MKRKNLLPQSEYEQIFGRPDHEDAPKEKLFFLNENDLRVAQSFKKIDLKVLFVLALGYFRMNRILFSYDKKEDLENCRYIEKTYFKQKRKNWGGPTIDTKNHQNRIFKKVLSHEGYKPFSKDQKQLLQKRCAELVKISPKPTYLVRYMVLVLEEHRTALPSYSTFQDLIGQAIKNERQRIADIFSQDAPAEVKRQLTGLLEDGENINKLTLLKRDPKNFGYSEVSLELCRLESIELAYKFAKKFNSVVDISPEARKYYSSFVERSTIDALRQYPASLANAFILFFICTKIKKINNDLVKCFFYHVDRVDQKAKEAMRERLLKLQEEAGEKLTRAEKVWGLFHDEKIPNERSFGAVREKASSYLTEEDFLFVRTYMLQAGIDKERIYWEEIEKNARRFKMNLRHILKDLKIKALKQQSSVFQVLDQAKNLFSNNKTLDALPKSVAKKIIPKKKQQFLFKGDEKLARDRFEFHLYLKVKDEFEKGNFSCPDSIDFKSLEDDLMSAERWKRDRDSLLDKAGLSHLKVGPKKILAELETKLSDKYRDVNSCIEQGKNRSITWVEGTRNKKGRWKLNYEGKERLTDGLFFEQHPQVSIHSLLLTVNEITGFTEAFTHVSGRPLTQARNPLLATILALGTNTGIRKMSSTSDVGFQQMVDSLKNYVCLDNIRRANDIISNASSKLPTFQKYSLGGEVHGSSDGQKFEVDRPTLKARYSPKYFGLKKGVSAYSHFVSQVPVNSVVIGSNDHESHFVYDIVSCNTSEIETTVHSTDSHGLNSLNFLLLDQISVRFAPRYKKINNVIDKLVGFESMLKDAKDAPIEPQEKVDHRLITREWEEVLRILASISLKECSQSTIVKKLSSHNRKSQVQQAMWQWDAILESMYVLDFIGSMEFRQNIETALNRGESYHALRRAVSVANSRSFRPRSDNEIEVWNQCSRLIANCVIFYNTLIIAEVDKKANFEQLPCPVAWNHTNFSGWYNFGESQAIDLEAILSTFLVF